MEEERRSFLPPKERERRGLEELSSSINRRVKKREREKEKGSRGLLVSGLCLGTSMLGSEAMMDDEQGLEMLECAYQQYGINFFVSEKQTKERKRQAAKGKERQKEGLPPFLLFLFLVVCCPPVWRDEKFFACTR